MTLLVPVCVLWRCQWYNWQVTFFLVYQWTQISFAAKFIFITSLQLLSDVTPYLHWICLTLNFTFSWIYSRVDYFIASLRIFLVDSYVVISLPYIILSNESVLYTVIFIVMRCTLNWGVCVRVTVCSVIFPANDNSYLIFPILRITSKNTLDYLGWPKRFLDIRITSVHSWVSCLYCNVTKLT